MAVTGLWRASVLLLLMVIISLQARTAPDTITPGDAQVLFVITAIGLFLATLAFTLQIVAQAHDELSGRGLLPGGR